MRAAAPGNVWLGRRTVAVTHNGGEREVPGDTLFALRRAQDLHMDVVDADVQRSKDGVPVLAHDDTLEASTDGTGRISDHTAAELSRLDACYWWVPGRGHQRGLPPASYPYRGVRTGQKPLPAGASSPDEFGVPTLEQVFDRCSHTYLDIELKPQSHTAPEVANLIRQFHRESLTIVASFDDAQVAEFQKLAPTVATSPGKRAATGFYLGEALAPGFQILQLPYRYHFEGRMVTAITPAVIERAHQQGVAVWVWDEGGTPGPALYARLATLGVDGILAGLPSDLLSVLHQLARRWDGQDHVSRS